MTAVKGGEIDISAKAQKGKINKAAVDITARRGDVELTAVKGGEIDISALAQKGKINSATVDIDARGRHGDVEMTAVKGGEIDISAKAQKGKINKAAVDISAGDDVKLTAVKGGEIDISALAQKGKINKAAVDITARRGDVELTAVKGGEIEIDAIAKNAKSSSVDGGDVVVASSEGQGEGQNGGINMARVDIDAGGDIKVLATKGGDVEVKAEAMRGYINTAKVWLEACDDVKVIATKGGDVEIEALAQKGNTNNACIGVFAGDDVKVIGTKGGDAEIEAKAQKGNTNNACVLVSAGGDVEVIGTKGGRAEIESLAQKGNTNNAGVLVDAVGDVRVIASKGGEAKIESKARYGNNNFATTQVYGNMTYVSAGAFIIASVPGDEKVVTNFTGVRLSYLFGDSIIVIGSHEDAPDYSDCRECWKCPCCPPPEEQPPVIPPAALNAMQFTGLNERVPSVSGCPAVIAAAAEELGISQDNIQVTMGDSMAAASDIQPCDTCSRLVNAARVLDDEDGSRFAALVEVINSVAPANMPFTPEIGTQIAAAFEQNMAEGTAYATASEYMDAFVQYVSILDKEMKSPVGDSVAFVMGKHGQNIGSSANPNLAAYIAARLEAIGG
jgi:hypothetical protein